MGKEFSIFGFGRDGIPCLIRRWFANGGEERAAYYVAKNPDANGAKTLSLLLLEHAGVPSYSLRASASVFGLISTAKSSRLPTPEAKIRKALGLPPRVNKFRQFVEIAGREAFALALTVRRDNVDLGEVLRDLAARVANGHWALSVNALAAASSQSWEFVDADTMRELRPPPGAEKARPGVSRSVIAGKKGNDGTVEPGWREYPEYRHMVGEIACHMILGLSWEVAGKSLRISRNPLRVREDISDEVIREIAIKCPSDDILEFAGEVPTVGSASPSRVARGGVSLFDIKPVGIS